MSTHPIQGERLLLRPWTRADIPNLLRHGNDPEVARNMVDSFPHPYEQEDAERWLGLNETEPFRGKHFAITLDGQAVGGAGYTPKTDVYRRTSDIGYWIGRAHWGKGIATEALGLLTDHVFAHTDIVRLEAAVFAWNPASSRVLEKCGYTLEARRPKSATKLGQVIDTLLWVKLRPSV